MSTQRKPKPVFSPGPMRRRSKQGRLFRRTVQIPPDTDTKQLLEKATRLTGQNQEEFILNAVRREAENVLLDQQIFLVNSEAFRHLQAELNDTSDNPALEKTLCAPALWE